MSALWPLPEIVPDRVERVDNAARGDGASRVRYVGRNEGDVARAHTPGPGDDGEFEFTVENMDDLLARMRMLG